MAVFLPNRSVIKVWFDVIGLKNGFDWLKKFWICFECMEISAVRESLRDKCRHDSETRPRRGPYELHVNGSSRIATQPDTLPFRVEKAITARLHYGTATIDAIASGFGASALPDTEACRGAGRASAAFSTLCGLAGRSTYAKRRDHPVAARPAAGLPRAEHRGRAFKRRTGRAPMEFRRELKQGRFDDA